MAAPIHLTEASSGAPVCSGQNGALVAIMDWALVQNGWTIDFSTGNARIYRAASGNRFRLHMNDDSSASGDARLCLVRGCESASSATALTDPFPLVSQVADNASNWLKSTVASATARNYDVYVGTTFVIFAVNSGGGSNAWDVFMFGDCTPTQSGDTYSTICFVRNSTGAGQAVANACGTATVAVNAFWYFTRSFDGTVKSTLAAAWVESSTSGSAIPFGAAGASVGAAFTGPTTGLDWEKVPLICAGAQSTTISTSKGLPMRAWLPNILNPIHNGNGTANARDTFSDTAYDAAFVGRIFVLTSGTRFVVVQESGTWAPPNG